MNVQNILYDPLLPWPVLAVLAMLALGFVGFALWRGLGGWVWRAMAALVLLGALVNPSLQREDRNTLSDIVIVVVDQSASQKIGDRPEQTRLALETLTRRLKARPDTELRVVTVPDGQGDSGTRLMTALRQTMADVPLARLAGAFLLTDGQLHDAALAPQMPAPLHVLLSGHKTDWDRRLTVKNAPAFAILGEDLMLTLRVDDQGTPPQQSKRVALRISIDGNEEQEFQVPVGKDLELPVTLPHGGMNIIRFVTPAADGELTTRNNAAVVQINGVRDRLRVLLISGQPYPGERTWRNLLKSDSSVDLVHFTILRPPEKQDGVPVTELSLIAFPVRELFMDKIDQFDLIVFDRYKLRGILPGIYLGNIRDYVEKGGAVLVAAGPAFASADSIYHSALGEIIPATPTARVLEEGYAPTITELGHRHPVTEGLENFAPNKSGKGPLWGRWLRQIEVRPRSGNVVMSGAGGRPLLILDRVGKGRIALLASDQAWLWARGFEGGGPQLELLRRLAHWMMKEPELEEEALWAEAEGQQMTIIRRTLKETVPDVKITAPDGRSSSISLQQVSPGRFEATYSGKDIGLYRLSDGIKDAVVALGPSAPREFVETLASGDKLAPIVRATNGGIVRIEDGMPRLRNVRKGRPAAGRGWLGLVPRNAYLTTDVTIIPLLPAWLVLLLVCALSVGAWLREGRR